MAKITILSLCILFNILTLPSLGTALSSCNGPCNDLNDCSGQLICINGKCNDDPDIGTHLCSTPPPGISPPPSTPSSCNGPCNNLNDCSGQLICINGKCNDDPDIGTHICSTPPSGRSSPPPPPSSRCTSSGSLECDGVSYPTFTCSPPVTRSTLAKLTNNDFSEGGDGGAPSECDERFHDNTERVVALSTGWYNQGSRCGKMIRIRSMRNGRSTTAKVVDECDSRHGCDDEHAFQPPCKNNIVDGSNAVWNALGLDIDVGVEDITWGMAESTGVYYD